MGTRKGKKKASAKRGGFSASERWILVETLLLVGLGKETLEWLVLERAPLPPVVAVLLGMVVVAGTLGGLVVLAEQRLKRSLKTAHRKVQRRYRLPSLVVHFVVLSAIFVAYAAFWNQETGALDAMEATLRRAWAEWMAS